MMYIGVMSKDTSETVYTYTNTRYKTFSAFPIEHFHQYEILEGTDPRAYVFNGYKEEFDESWTVPTESIDIIISKKLSMMDDFCKDLMDEFLLDNIKMGITEYGKTGDVLSVFTERVLCEGNTRPVSLMDTINSKSLDQTIKVIDHLLSNIVEYNDLAPFITTERLSTFKTKILTFLMS